MLFVHQLKRAPLMAGGHIAVSHLVVVEVMMAERVQAANDYTDGMNASKSNVGRTA